MQRSKLLVVIISILIVRQNNDEFSELLVFEKDHKQRRVNDSAASVHFLTFFSFFKCQLQFDNE